ncbi:MAG: acyltransferase family protein [Akkermansia sp.]|nr:acyltransferase [Akkermansiaceae bacterium]MBQ3143049.1 acyltransferase family protein [Akkermansia sp.]
MLTLLFLFLFISFLSCISGVERKMLTDGEYISRERTSTINGFFIWIVFACHLSQYTSDYLMCDAWITRLLMTLGQCVVATFFFFSGYGIMSSLRNKEGYASQLVKKRFLSLLLHMSLAVMLFYVVQFWYGREYECLTVFMSFFGWRSIGNSNWFIFVTLLSYLFITLSYRLCRRFGEFAIVVGVVVLFAVYVILARYRGGWWVDTCMCIPAGMLFFIWRPTIEKILNGLRMPVWLIGVLMVALGWKIYGVHFLLVYSNIPTVIFAMGVCLTFSCIRMRKIPAFLSWSGGPALFTLYIFQRIPMIIGVNEGLKDSYPQVYILCCLLGTLFLGWLGMKFFSALDKLIFRVKDNKVH